MPQNDQSLLMVNTGELRRPVGAPDETGLSMPPEAVSGIRNTWVYGDPLPGFAGQTCTGTGCAAAQGGMAEPAPVNGAGAPMPARGESAPSASIQGMNGEEYLNSISSAAAQSYRMKNPVDMATTHMPANSNEAYQASLRSLLNRNVGYFIVATFLMGPQQMVTWQGILHTVGSDYIVIYQPNYERYVSGDLYSLKFVQFHNVKDVPYCAASQNWQGQTGL